jgi:hypothetical protein
MLLLLSNGVLCIGGDMLCVLCVALVDVDFLEGEKWTMTMKFLGVEKDGKFTITKHAVFTVCLDIRFVCGRMGRIEHVTEF